MAIINKLRVGYVRHHLCTGKSLKQHTINNITKKQAYIIAKYVRHCRTYTDVLRKR